MGRGGEVGKLALQEVRNSKVALVSQVNRGSRICVVCKDRTGTFGSDWVGVSNRCCCDRERRGTGVRVHGRGTCGAIGVRWLGLCGDNGNGGRGGLAGVGRVAPRGLREAVARLVVS